ncbi:hypothetical protein ACFYVR_18550 [Rhodococcus sp. NPDC003318]|uniref:hypothetical protein n=1 Tax=Rhodococcus sp. NPDC003318 TaxID=3364503 RepID=UPI0036C6819C
MSNAVLLAYVQPTSPADEAEFNHWYDEVHIPQLIDRVPGVHAARRFQFASDQFEGTSPPAHGYLTLYEIDANDVAGTIAEIGKAMTDGSLELTTTLDAVTTPAVMHVYQPA